VDVAFTTKKLHHHKVLLAREANMRIKTAWPMVACVLASIFELTFVCADARAEGPTPVIGSALNDRDGNSLGVVADIFGTNQFSIPLAAIRFSGAPTLVIVPLTEVSVVNGTFRYWGTNQQFQEIPKHIVLLTTGTSSVATGGQLPSAISVLAVPSVPLSSNVVDMGASTQPPQPPANYPNEVPGNPYARAGSDIKSVWGGANSVIINPGQGVGGNFRRPF
jgi:hypothetical protein